LRLQSRRAAYAIVRKIKKPSDLSLGFLIFYLHNSPVHVKPINPFSAIIPAQKQIKLGEN